MTNQSKLMSVDPERELYIERVLRAPRELVWKVCTEPAHLVKWWGPDGFTNTVSVMDVRVGGKWNLTMHGPDGTDYPNEKVYRVVEKPGKLVFDHVSAPHHTTTIILEDLGKETRLCWHMLFESKEEFEVVVKTYKADEGLAQNIDKLERYFTMIND
jgi:uncharacterized protein YndB with AHSA1/START domain